MLIDSWGRQITYLRISVTDRCNLRCVYCMPPEGIQLQAHEDILRYEEIAEVVRAAAQEGVREVRLTGGEPLTRPNLPALVGMLSSIPGIQDISLTTNAILLERFAAPLAEAGLKRVNISLDTLRPERFAKITRGGSFEQAWRGILAAEQAGLTPLKINAVAMRGINEDEFLDLARLSVDHPWQVRFIEIMPVKNETAWGDGFPNPTRPSSQSMKSKTAWFRWTYSRSMVKAAAALREICHPRRAGTHRLYLTRSASISAESATACA